MSCECLIGENTCRTNLYKIAAKLTLERTVFMTAEINAVVPAKNAEVAPASVIVIKSDASITLYAAVHFVLYERPEVLVPVGALFETIPAVNMPRHKRHILQVAFAALIANRAIMRMIYHKPFYYAFAEFDRFRVIYGNPCAIVRGRHARHNYFAFCVVGVLELFDRAHPAGAYGIQRGMPAEIWNIKSKGQTGIKKILPGRDFVWLVIHVNRRH
jgi:hypothetical protein